MSFAIIRCAKLNTHGSISGSGSHSFRERPTPNADPTRRHLNQVLIGPTSTSGLLAAIDTRVSKATHTAPEKPVLAIEYFIGMSPEAKVAKSPDAYFRDAIEWLKDRHGAENVVSAVVHNDETTPHLAAYVVPLHTTGGKVRKRNVADGRNPDGTRRRKVIEQTVGGQTWLSANAYMGTRAKLSAMQTDFAAKVGAKHGLKRGLQGSRAHHTTIKQFYAALDAGAIAGMDAQLAQFFRAANMKRLAMQQQAKQAQAALEEAQKRLEASKKTQADQVAQLRETQAVEVAKLKTAVADGRQKLSEVMNWLGDILRRIWDAMAAGDLPTAREVISEALRGDPEEWPSLRAEVRQLADGSWRAAVIDAAEVEQWSDLYDDQDSARDAAQSWIANAGPAPGM